MRRMSQRAGLWGFLIARETRFKNGWAETKSAGWACDWLMALAPVPCSQPVERSFPFGCSDKVKG